MHIDTHDAGACRALIRQFGGFVTLVITIASKARPEEELTRITFYFENVDEANDFLTAFSNVEIHDATPPAR